jgi:phosphoglucomutase
VTAYYPKVPDPDNTDQQVAFGTSGHRGSVLDGAFNEALILAITQAIVEDRAAAGRTGPLRIGRYAHGLSENPPRDGGVKYNPLHGGTVDAESNRHGVVTPDDSRYAH